jgi:hypothetical protein
MQYWSVIGLVFYRRIATEYAWIQEGNWYVATGNQSNGESFVYIKRRKRKSD